MPAEPSRAVFLSYASQDSEATRRICDSLRSGGVEVWFDADGGLEHGDEWDQKIRRQIKECVLFIPVISASTQAREEGYFRIEWELAAQRALGIASGVPFILPVVIDDTREPDALVPDRFRAVQWTRLPGGVVTPEVKARYLKLWSHRTGVLKNEAQEVAQASSRPADVGASLDDARGRGRATPLQKSSRAFLFPTIIGVVLVVAAVLWLRHPAAESPGQLRQDAAATPTKPAAPLSEVRQLAEKARALFQALDSVRDDFHLAEDLLKQALAKDSADAEVWACYAQLHNRFVVRGWEVTNQRKEGAQVAAQRALRLDPQSFEARFAQASLAGDTPSGLADGERAWRELRREHPTDQRVLVSLAIVLRKLNRQDEANALYDESAALPGGDPIALYDKSLDAWFLGRTAEAEAAMRAAVAQKPFSGALLMTAWYAMILHGDLDDALSAMNRVSPATLREDRGCFLAYYLHYLRRETDAALARLRELPRDWIDDNWYRGPKGKLAGEVLQRAGRTEAAAAEWRAALKLVETRLAAAPTNSSLLYNRIYLLANLGERDEAARQFAVLLQMAGINLADGKPVPIPFTRICVLLGRHAEAIQQIRRGLKVERHAVDYTAATLRLDGDWDPLRNDPEFAKVIAEAEAMEKAAALSATPPPAKLGLTAPAAPPAPSLPAVSLLTPSNGLSPAREFVAKALVLLHAADGTREDFALAEDYCDRAMKLDSTDGEVWAAGSQLHGAYVYRGFEPTPERREKSRTMAERAIRLAPNSAEAKLAQAGAWSNLNINRDDTERLLREVVQERPTDQNALKFLAVTVLNRGALDECLALNERSAALPGGDPLALYNNARYLWQRNRPVEAYATLQRSLAQKPLSSALVLMTVMQINWRGDLAAADTTSKQIPPSFQLEDRANFHAGLLAYFQRRPDVALARWNAFPREFYSDFNYDGPKGYLLGLAHELAHRDDAARLEWRTALQATEKRLAASPNNLPLLYWKTILLSCLGDKTAAEESLRTYEQLNGLKWTPESVISPGQAFVYLRLGRGEDVLAHLPASLAKPGVSGMWPARLRLDPRFDQLRKDPRFEKLLAQYPLPDADKK